MAGLTHRSYLGHSSPDPACSYIFRVSQLTAKTHHFRHGLEDFQQCDMRPCAVDARRPYSRRREDAVLAEIRNKLDVGGTSTSPSHILVQADGMTENDGEGRWLGSLTS